MSCTKPLPNASSYRILHVTNASKVPQRSIRVRSRVACSTKPDSITVWNGDVATFQPPFAQHRVHAPPGSRPLVILPGFGNCSQDYIAPFGQLEQALSTHLKDRGFSVYVLPLERKDWFNVARSLFTFGIWSGSLTTHPGYTWYLDRVSETIERALRETGAEQVDIVAHSAGGWLARAFLADPVYNGAHPVDGSQDDKSNPVAMVLERWQQLLQGADSRAGNDSKDNASTNTTTTTSSGSRSSSSAGTSSSSSSSSSSSGTTDPASSSAALLSLWKRLQLTWLRDRRLNSGTINRRVRSLVTLGTPHCPPPADLVRDMTGGALTWVNGTYPGAYFKDSGVRYICVVGRAVRGNPQAVRGTPGSYAYNSYSQVCGVGAEVEGDAVVPLRSGTLEGAEVIELRGVFHSMSRVGTFEEESGVPWYGSGNVVDYWLRALVDEDLNNDEAGLAQVASATTVLPAGLAQEA